MGERGPEDRSSEAAKGESREGSRSAQPETASVSFASGDNGILEKPGETIGEYKLLQQIGEGGFGVVYMAQQSEPIRRKVALKIVKPGMDTKQVIGRFEAERQTLAMMDHPNIARVLDAGATPSGRPYFVMELVKGVPITEYCDSAKLTTGERIKIFQSVCHAVQHAHQKGIIHRDLKPSNVLVTLHDGEPVVKVIDFGIAKATGQELAAQTFFTEFKQFIGTPEYMSPEQAAMSGLDVDTRADIYSLGVLLYELIAGATPFDSSRLRGVGYEEMRRMIRDDEPPKPSTRLSKVAKDSIARTVRGSGVTEAGGSPASGGTTTAEEIARHRRTDVQSLRRALAGDLDWIVMKAMEKDRTRRYQTAAAFAEDLRRFLGHEPISARPPTALYRARKFARRNRALIGAGGAVVMALLLTVAALAYGMSRAGYERNKTAERATEARAQIVLSAMNSVRKYTTNNVRPALKKTYGDGFAKEMIPGFSARMVFDNFKGDPVYADFVYKEASPNPTNRSNTADEFERAIVEGFRGDRERKETSGIRDRNGVRTYYIARPMVVGEKSCLDCHTTPDIAPPEQVREYGSEGGYGWKLNDVIAAQMVYVPVSQAFHSDRHDGALVIGAIAGALVLVGVIGAVVLSRA